ncbi:hypothetical protein [Spiroplasma endosymbiont of Crioceris asparagi]|uniref:hypothetical protein n=1 Tax=Spiroplasma endosymbiont of Crioceris asparagi TaxID=3066286 RepID=UPI0030D176C5
MKFLLQTANLNKTSTPVVCGIIILISILVFLITLFAFIKYLKQRNLKQKNFGETTKHQDLFKFWTFYAFIIVMFSAVLIFLISFSIMIGSF